MTALLSILIRWGLPPRLARLVAWAGLIAAVLALTAGALVLHRTLEARAYNSAFNAGWSALAKQDAAAVTAAANRNATATATSAVERAQDSAAIADASKDRTDAVSSAPSSSIGAATHALGCVRWSQQHPGSARPTGC